MPASTFSYDFSSPFMAARIIGPRQELIPLWTNSWDNALTSKRPLANAPVGTMVEVSSMPWVSEVRVQLQLGFIPIIQATLTPPFEDGRAFLDSDLIEWSVSHLQVQFGYAGGSSTPGSPALMSPVFEGILLKPDVELGADVVITLKAQGVGTFSLSRQCSGGVYYNYTRMQIIQDILKGSDPDNPRQFTVDLNNAPDSLLTEAGRRLNTRLENWSQANRSDWLAINMLATECLCWPLFANGKLVLRDKTATLQGNPVKTFVFRDFNQTVGPSVGEYPILSASSPTSAIYMPGTLRGYVLQGVDPTGRTPLSVAISDETQKYQRVGSKENASAGPIPNPEMPNIKVPYTGDPSNPGVKENADAEMQRQLNMMGVHIEVETLGVPDLLPGDLIAIRGMGNRLDSTYAVFTVSHTFGGGGFLTSFTAVSNTAQMIARALGLQGTLNYKEPIPPDQQGTVTVPPKTGQGTARPRTH